MGAIVTEICEILVQGITTLGAGIASGVASMVTALFLDGTGASNDPYKLSVTGGVIAIFGGIGLSVSLTKRVYSWIMSLGARA